MFFVILCQILFIYILCSSFFCCNLYLVILGKKPHSNAVVKYDIDTNISLTYAVFIFLLTLILIITKLYFPNTYNAIIRSCSSDDVMLFCMLIGLFVSLIVLGSKISKPIYYKIAYKALDKRIQKNENPNLVLNSLYDMSLSFRFRNDLCRYLFDNTEIDRQQLGIDKPWRKLKK